jgi:selenocysteine lyase/cysteine desulfurase
VRGWDVDYYVLSLYKVYGPHHALLYGKYAQLLELENLYHYFIANDRIPYKLQPGNPNYELSYGAIGIADYLSELGARAGASAGASPRAQMEGAFAAIADHEEALAHRLLRYLSTRPRVRVIGAATADQAVRVPTISFVVDGLDSETIVRHIDTLQIGIRFGDFHSRRLVERLDLSRHHGAVRVSMVHYNTVEEIDRLIQGLDEVM